MQRFMESISSSPASESTSFQIQRLVWQTDHFIRDNQEAIQDRLKHIESQSIVDTTPKGARLMKAQLARSNAILIAMEKFRAEYPLTPESAPIQTQAELSHGQSADGELLPNEDAARTQIQNGNRTPKSDSLDAMESITPSNTEDDGSGSVEAKQNPTSHSQRFLPETTQEWIRKTRLQKEITKADEEAQSKCKRRGGGGRNESYYNTDEHV